MTRWSNRNLVIATTRLNRIRTRTTGQLINTIPTFQRINTRGILQINRGSIRIRRNNSLGDIIIRMVHCRRGCCERDRDRRFRFRILAHNQNICFTTRGATQILNCIGILINFKGINTCSTRDNIVAFTTGNSIRSITSINRVNALTSGDNVSPCSTRNLKCFRLSR